MRFSKNASGFILLLPILLCALSLSIILTATSCTPAAGSGSAKATITRVGWYIESLPTDFWPSTNTTKQTLAYDFWVYFSGNIGASDIASVRIYQPGGTKYWSIDPTTMFDASRKAIGGWGRWCYDADPNALPIGTLTAEIVLTNGRSSTLAFSTGVPGSITSGSHSFVYSEDESGAGLSLLTSPVPALKRATVNSLTNNGTTVTVTFTTHDDATRNGLMWFYDDSGAYLGTFFYFLDPSTGTVTSRLTGSTFTANGSNTIALSAADIQDANGNALASVGTIAHCRVGVMDGQQYAGSGSGHFADCDYRAISGYY